MLEDYIKNQEIATKLLLESINNDKLVQAYLFVSKDEKILLDYSLAFVKKIITPEYNTNICSKIDKNIYNELKIINPESNLIKKEQLLDLQNSFKTKAIEGNKKIYIINKCEKMNSAAANSILKFLEEPQDNIIAILLTTNIDKVMPTIKSRCQIISLFNNEENMNDIEDIIYQEYNKIENNIDNEQLEKNIEKIKKYSTILEKDKIKMIFYYKDFFDIFKTKEEINIFFIYLIYFYYDLLNIIIEKNIRYIINKDELLNFKNNNTTNSVIKKIQIIQNSKNNLNTNMNLKLLMDDFLINFSEV